MIQLSDVRYALRLWRRHPTLVLVAGLSLGLGVGATTTMYSVVNRVAHYELGFADVDRLAVLWSTDTERGIQEQPPTWEIVQAVLEHGQSFEAFGFFQGGGAPVTLSGTTETRRVEQMPVDGNGLADRGRRPAAGADVPARGLRRPRQAEGSALDRRQPTTPGRAPGGGPGRDRHVDPRRRRAPHGDRRDAARASASSPGTTTSRSGRPTTSARSPRRAG